MDSVCVGGKGIVNTKAVFAETLQRAACSGGPVCRHWRRS